MTDKTVSVFAKVIAVICFASFTTIAAGIFQGNQALVIFPLVMMVLAMIIFSVSILIPSPQR